MNDVFLVLSGAVYPCRIRRALPPVPAVEAVVDHDLLDDAWDERCVQLVDKSNDDDVGLPERFAVLIGHDHNAAHRCAEFCHVNGLVHLDPMEKTHRGRVNAVFAKL